MTTQELRVGVIGVGMMGADHAHRLVHRVAGARLVAVSDPDTARAAALAASFPGVRAIADPLALVADDEVDAVVIASPGFVHEEQVLAWRRSYDTPPPSLPEGDERDSALDRRYAGLGARVPRTECLKDTVARVVPYWRESIAPRVAAGERVLVAAHGNSLRGLVKFLDGVSDADIVSLNIPTAIPLVYELDDGLNPLRHYYLGDPEAVAKAAAAVASQGKAR